jgi:imidazoleglycerol-phosphate dehydratase
MQNRTKSTTLRVATEPEAAGASPPRIASIERKTRETRISIELKLDGSGTAAINTGVRFLNHMLESFARHGFFDLKVTAEGDLEIDDHHTVEDVGIVLGRAFRSALGDRSGIRRFGEATVPLDEALVSAVVDVSGRTYIAYNIKIGQERVGAFQTILVHDFMKALADETGMNLHLNLHGGRNPHHIIEATFKALARAMDMATTREPRAVGVLSTKGTLS